MRISVMEQAAAIAARPRRVRSSECAGDARDQAEPTHATDVPGESSRLKREERQSGLLGAVRGRRTADAAGRGATPARFVVEVQPFDQAIFVAAILAEPTRAEPGRCGRRGRTGTASIVGSSRAGCRADQSGCRSSSWGAQFAAAGARAMFHPAVALKKETSFAVVSMRSTRWNLSYIFTWAPPRRC